MKHKTNFRKIPFKTKLRYVFLGKYPLERRYKPKILEYLFMIFSNIILMVLSILVIFLIKSIIRQSTEENFWGNISIELNKYEWRVLISVAVICYLVNLVLSIHVLYILNKTEFNKRFGVAGVIFSVLGMSPLAIIFLIIGYQKNELAFE